jgi:putative two-component system response regulator
MRFAAEVAPIVRSHHERWDGTGYPDRLRGDQIPLGARILAVVDAWDAMTTDRPYRSALERSEAVQRLRRGAGTQWDPNVVEAFLALEAEHHLMPLHSIDFDSGAWTRAAPTSRKSR